MNATNYEVEIESGIPIPNPKVGLGRRAKYPWANLEVGQSFVVRLNAGENLDRLRNRVGNIITHARKKSPEKRFVTRGIEDGIRIWRVE